MNPGNKAVKLDSQFVMYSSTASGPVISYSRDLIHWEIQNVEFDLLEKSKPAEICMAMTDYHENGDHIILFLRNTVTGRAWISTRDPQKINQYREEHFLITGRDKTK